MSDLEPTDGGQGSSAGLAILVMVLIVLILRWLLGQSDNSK